MTEKIFLTYTNATAVPYQGSVLGHHVVLNYIDSSGNHFTIEGVPQHKFDHNLGKLGAFLREEGLSNGVDNQDSPFGRLQVRTGSGSKDALGGPQTMIAEGNGLRDRWNRMLDFIKGVNSIGYEYRPYSQNSNSFAAGALKHAGLIGPGTATPEIFDRLIAQDPSTGDTRSISVPGFDRRLENPLNAFDNRFGRWASTPAGNAPREPRQPSVFDTGAPAVPFAPATICLLPAIRLGSRIASERGNPPCGSDRSRSPIAQSIHETSVSWAG